MEKLTKDQIYEQLKEVKGWTTDGKSITKTFRTKGFPQTLGLVTAIGAICQQHDHHPDYLTLKYDTVEVSFSTHTAGGITHKDVEIAAEINRLTF